MIRYTHISQGLAYSTATLYIAHRNSQRMILLMLQKLQVFLFDRILVLSRPSMRTGEWRYQIHRTPIPVSELLLETEGDGKHGSFRQGLSQGHSSKHAFRVSFLHGSEKGMAHTLVANDEHDKRQWVTALRSVLPEGHEGRDNIRRKQLQLKRDNPEGFNTSDMSIDFSMSSVASSCTVSSEGSAPSSVKRSGSSASDRVTMMREGAAHVKRSGSSVSDNQVMYKDYAPLRLLTSPRQSLYDIPDDDEVMTRSKRRRSVTSTVTRGAEGSSAADDSTGMVKPKRRGSRTPPKVHLHSDDESFTASLAQAESPGWEGHDLPDCIAEERGSADGMA